MAEFRWSQLASSQDGLFERSRRVVGRGEYKGLTFHEIEARSIISKAPPSTPWFGYSINAYRGCSHACSYCLAGDTPILLANGRTKPIAELERGEAILGTRLEHGQRRLVRSVVVDQWATIKASHRVSAGDKVLISSADHRFLSSEGWKHVSGSDPLRNQAPQLNAGDRLLAFNGHAGSPDELLVTDVQALGDEIPMYDITTTTGDFIANGVVSHNCFARPTHEYLGFNMAEDFEQQIVVKTNAVELCRAETEPARWAGDSIAMGTNTDPYQAAEGKYKLTKGIIEVLADRGNGFSILTKSPLVLRDLDLISEAAKRATVSVSFSVATLDEGVWRRTEPGAPHPRKRLDALARLREAGVSGGVMVAPVLPGISDSPEQVAALKKAARESGAAWVNDVKLHLRGVRPHFLQWLAEDSPNLVPMYSARFPIRTRRSGRKKSTSPANQGQLFDQ